MTDTDTDTFPPDYDEDEDEGFDEEGEEEQPEAKAEDRTLAPIPIGQVSTAETLQGVAAFTRSLNLGHRDDNAHFRVELPFVVQPGWSWGEIAAQAADAMYHCKAVVYEQAGVPFTVDEGGVLRETIRRALPGAEEQRPARAREREDRDRGREDGDGERRRPREAGGSFAHPSELDQPRHVSDALWDDLCNHYEDWFDNRRQKANGEYKSTASDFVRREDRKSIWLKPMRREGGGRGSSSSSSGGGGRRRGYDD